MNKRKDLDVHEDPVVIVGSARTPIGGLLGFFEQYQAPELGAFAIEAALKRAQLKPSDIADITEVLMGCVLTAGLGQAPARQAARIAHLPDNIGATTINKMCGSGMQTLIFAYQALMHNPKAIMVAGGMESMSHAPFLLPEARKGYRLGHGRLIDHLLYDGLEDAYSPGKSMGYFAEKTAEKFQFSRKVQDEFASLSLTRAKMATDEKLFLNNSEIVPVPVKIANVKAGASTSANTKNNKDNSGGLNKEELLIDYDELPRKASLDKIPLLKPAFAENGTVTAANSSSISDGSAAHILMRLSEADHRHIQPIAKILGVSSFATDPHCFTEAPIGAVQALYQKLQWTDKEVDLYEINEAFAVVPLLAMQKLNIDKEKVNIHGGACAMGHPIGASGARIVCTLLGALKRTGKKRGIATLCIGGGEATAIALEII